MPGSSSSVHVPPAAKFLLSASRLSPTAYPQPAAPRSTPVVVIHLSRELVPPSPYSSTPEWSSVSRAPPGAEPPLHVSCLSQFSYSPPAVPQSAFVAVAPLVHTLFRPMDVEAAQGEALQDMSTTRRDRARIESRGGDTAPTNNRRANGGLASFAQPGILRRSTPERHHQGHWPPLVSDGAHHRVRVSAQRPPVTAPGSRDSSLRSQDARCGATIFTLRGRLWGGRPATVSYTHLTLPTKA